MANHITLSCVFSFTCQRSSAATARHAGVNTVLIYAPGFSRARNALLYLTLQQTQLAKACRAAGCPCSAPLSRTPYLAESQPRDQTSQSPSRPGAAEGAGDPLGARLEKARSIHETSSLFSCQRPPKASELLPARAPGSLVGPSSPVHVHNELL